MRPVPRRSRGRRRAAGRRLSAALAVALGLAAAADDAEADSPVLVELFTSQGCSACPPADALLAELADRPDVVALSLHVDWWDYLGWRDVFAQPVFGLRQKAYRDAAGERSVYTPQIVVDGAEAMVGSRREAVLAAVEAAAARPDRARLALELGPESVAVRIAPNGRPAPEALIWFVTYRTPEPVRIERGENAGRAVRYRNVAQSWMKLGRWDGRAEAAFVAPAPPQGVGVAVIAQAGPVGPVLAAAKLAPR